MSRIFYYLGAIDIALVGVFVIFMGLVSVGDGSDWPMGILLIVIGVIMLMWVACVVFGNFRYF